MKSDAKQIALERMHILVKKALSNARQRPELAQRQAGMARRISTKYRIKMPYEIRMNFCKKCKMFIVPGVSSRVRLGRSTLKSVRITCNYCNHTYRKVIPKMIYK
ncbi:MAG: RNase P subunit [Candidatus Nitrosotenuis sp.]|nr:RNase P subunit [Candidatus Nitrosotenuis sp.]